MVLAVIVSVIAFIVGACGFLALVLSPIVIAVAIANGQRWLAAAVLMVVAAFFAAGQYQAEHASEAAINEHIGALRLYVVLTYALFSAPGIVMAVGLARAWTYTRVVTAIAVLVFVLMTLGAVLNWQEWNDQVNSMFELQRQMIKGQVEQRGQEFVDEALAVLAWMRDNKLAINFSLMFLMGLIVSCIYASLTGFIMHRILRKRSFAGSFKDFRPTEWLVWAAIAAALGCLVEYRWPNPLLRDVAWNSAIALSAVYWFAGLAIVVYGVHVLRPSPPVFLVFLLAVILIINFGMLPVLALIGLFDTWGNYRRKVDLIAAARRAGGPPPIPPAT